MAVAVAVVVVAVAVAVAVKGTRELLFHVFQLLD